MDTAFALEKPPQNVCAPRLHEMLVRSDDDSLRYGYLAVEVTRSSFPEACRFLHETRGLDHDLVPLVLSHFPLSSADTKLLPERVPWLRAMPGSEGQLHAVHTALVTPLEQRGLLCVDFAELVAVLANGGEARLRQASGRTTASACDALHADAESCEWLSTPGMAACLHIRANPGFELSEIDQTARCLESYMAEDSLVVVSVRPREGVGSALTLLAVSPRRRVATAHV